MSSVLRLGVYRERIEKYGGAAKSNSNGHAANGNGGVKCEELLTVTVERQVGVKLKHYIMLRRLQSERSNLKLTDYVEHHFFELS